MEDWKLILEEKPEYRKRVELKLVENNTTVWETTGYLLKDNLYSIKMTDGLIFANSRPSHWRFIS